MSHTPPTAPPLLIALLRLQALGPKNASHNVRKIIGPEYYAQLSDLIARCPLDRNDWPALLGWLIADLQKQRLLDILLHLAQHGPRDPGQGICLNADHLAKEQTADGSRTMQCILYELMARWPDSLDPDGAYPVEGSPAAYFQAGSNKWQDHRRLALLNWLIEELQKDVHTTA